MMAAPRLSALACGGGCLFFSGEGAMVQKVAAGIDDGGHDCYKLCMDPDRVLLLLRCGFVVLQGAWGCCNGCANLFWLAVQGQTRDGGVDLCSRERREGDDVAGVRFWFWLSARCRSGCNGVINGCYGGAVAARREDEEVVAADNGGANEIGDAMMAAPRLSALACGGGCLFFSGEGAMVQKVAAGIDDGGHDCYKLCMDPDRVLLLLRCGFVVLQGAWGCCNGCANLFWLAVQGQTRDGGVDLCSRERREGDDVAGVRFWFWLSARCRSGCNGVINGCYGGAVAARREDEEVVAADNGGANEVQIYDGGAAPG
ncbi:hypothetical protein DEO72_LG8g2138 [Vigna unguiculata]|uniref:Uncharacterized protein n=1 Tax=Vigna unguiculata TaxID=3917 RepID=A0A4D6MW42_VIGUN|nr:hypothetical protein DEO72_LG8g2138 [Vigna unguiculata]